MATETLHRVKGGFVTATAMTLQGHDGEDVAAVEVTINDNEGTLTSSFVTRETWDEIVAGANGGLVLAHHLPKMDIPKG